MIQRIADTLDFQAKALLLRSERQRMIAGNIANADTPGYVAREMNFSAALRSAVARGPSAPGESTSVAGGLPMAATAPGHLRSGPAQGLNPALRYALPAQANLDGNTVDMDRERAAFVDNSVKMEASLRFISGSVRTLLDAIRGNSQ
jgi:flagellar basal-body rod protein FlgB